MSNWPVQTHTFIPLHRILLKEDWFSVYRVVTVFGKQEFSKLQVFCKRKQLSLYSLAKTSIREYVKRHG